MLSAKTGEVIFDGLQGAYPDDGYVTVYRDLHYGVIDPEGRTLLPLKFEHLEFHANCDCFEVRLDGQVGLLTRVGKPLLPLTYEFIRSDDGPGLWVVRSKRGFGAIEPRTGKVVLPAVYAEMQKSSNFIIGGKPGKNGMTWQAWDGFGKPVPGLQPASSLQIWENAGLLVVNERRVVDEHGRDRVQVSRYDYVHAIGGRAVIASKGRYGLIDAMGREIIPPSYQNLNYFNGNPFWFQATAFATNKQPGFVGVVDANGKVVVAPQWDDAQLDYSRQGEGKRESGFIVVRRNGRYGVFGLDGRLLLPVRFKYYQRLDYDSSVHIVVEDTGLGLCDFATGECPVPAKYEELKPLDYVGNGEQLFIVGKERALGVMDNYGHQILPEIFSNIRADDAGVVASGAQGVLPYSFERNASGQWHAVVGQSVPLIDLPYDRHPQAEKTHPLIEARYLPEKFRTDAQVLAGVAAGSLYDAKLPSIQLSARAAYLPVDEFINARGGLNDTLPWCRTPDGWRVVIEKSVDIDSNDVCADQALPSLHFHGDKDSRLVCEECVRHGLPEIWVRQDREAPKQCKSHPWSVDAARADYVRWFATWRKGWKAAEVSPDVARKNDVFNASVAPDSRAEGVLLQMLLQPSDLRLPLPKGIEMVAPEALADRLEALFAEAQPIGYGGLYPEPEARFANWCAEVWYLRLPSLEVRLTSGQLNPLGDTTPYALPEEGKFKRDAYPFITVSYVDGQMRLAGLSRELIQVLFAR